MGFHIVSSTLRIDATQLEEAYDALVERNKDRSDPMHRYDKYNPLEVFPSPYPDLESLLRYLEFDLWIPSDESIWIRGCYKDLDTDRLFAIKFLEVLTSVGTGEVHLELDDSRYSIVDGKFSHAFGTPKPHSPFQEFWKKF